MPLAILVVFAHSFGEPPEYRIPSEAFASGLNAMDIYNLLRLFFSRVLSQVAVPAFFVISGYLFFIKANVYDWGFYKRQWSKRLFSLLIPYLLWNIIAAVCQMATDPSKPVGDYLTLDIFWNYSHWQDLADGPSADGPLVPALWFVRDLMVVVLLTPLLERLLRVTKGLVVVAMLYLALMGIGPSILHCAALFFSIGAYMSVNKMSFTALFQKILVVTLPSWLVLLPVSLYYYGTQGLVGLIISKNMLMVGIFAVIGATASFLSKREENPTEATNGWKRTLSFAADNTFFIYLTHTIFGIQGARVLMGLLFGVMPDNAVSMSLRYLLIPFLAVGICLFVLFLMRRFMPKTTAVLAGER